MDELDALLAEAKSRASTSNSLSFDEEDPIEAVKNLPQLKVRKDAAELVDEKTTKPKDRKRLAPLKALPTSTKPEKDDTAGDKWFNMGAPRMTPELKRDLQLLKMRHALDPKRFYKKETAAPSKYFAVGTIQESPTEFFSGRLTRRERKSTLAEEILATRQDYFKSRYKTIQQAKQSGRRKHQKKLRDMRA